MKNNNKKWNLMGIKAKIRKAFPKTFEDLEKKLEEKENKERKN